MGLPAPNDWNVAPKWATPENVADLEQMLEDLDHYQTALDHAVPCQQNVKHCVASLVKFYRERVADDYYGGP